MPQFDDAQLVDTILNSSVIAGRLISQEPRRHGRITAAVGPHGELITDDSFRQIYYRGKPVERDTTAQSAIIYVRPERRHWWQFWRPKPVYLSWKGIGRKL